MIPWEVLGRARAPDGGELILSHRDGEFVIRVDGRELMSSRGSNSEQAMARLAIARVADNPRDGDLRLLIGGLGMGYTTRAALDALPRAAEVTIAELVPAVVEWNQGPLGHLARRPLDDKRARVAIEDVGRLMARTTVRFDAILLDVDNGPQGLTRKSNQLLYADAGLATARRALRPGGVLAVWSASPDRPFEKRLRKAGFEVESVETPARGASGGPMHTLIFAHLPAVTRRRR